MPQPEIRDHQKYELMCALAAAHELDSTEQQDFDRHLAVCDACRAEVAGFRQVANQLADEQAPVRWPTLDEQPHAARFARFAAAEGLAFSQDARQALAGERVRRGRIPALAYAAAAVVVAIVGGTIMLRSRTAVMPARVAPGAETRSIMIPKVDANASSSVDHERIAQLESRLSEAQLRASQVPTLEQKLQAEQDRRTRLENLMAEREAEIAQFRAAAVESQNQLTAAQASITALSRKNDDLTASLASGQAQMAQLAEDLHTQKLSAEQDRQLTAATREVRELMGARRLFMIDVYDGDETRRGNRSFGRVFYTEGKSLIFYAFDLDRNRSSKRVTFTAWGELGTDAATIKPLGIFNLDDVAQKRWVMKVDDPEKLKSIDAIFVTVESRPGADRPSGKKLLYAYLGGQPNHP